MFRDNPEQFIARVGRLIVQEKANMVVDHICYDRIEGEYDSSIFTAGGNNRDEAEGYQASKCVQDWVFPDGKTESDFAGTSTSRRRSRCTRNCRVDSRFRLR